MKTLITRLLTAAFVAFVCMCSAVSASAKLGETVPQLIKRFGKSYRIESADTGNKYEFRSEKLRVDVLVANDVSIAETYFSDHALTANGEPPNDIVRTILKTNDPQTRWLEIDAAQFRSDYALRSSDQKYIAFLRYTGPQAKGFIWTMTVGAAKTLSSFSSSPPSPLASSEPSAPSKLGPKPGEQKPSFTVIISDGWIQVLGDNHELLGSMKTEQWAAALNRSLPVTRDDRRHFALNAVAAFVAGGGRREHTVDPQLQIVTAEESGITKNNFITLTLEGGMAFAILRDSKPQQNPYRAEIIRFTAEELKRMTSATPPKSDTTHYPRAKAVHAMNETGREWIMRNTTPKYIEGLFEAMLDETLMTEGPYQPPHEGNPYYNEQMERMINDPEYNDDKTNNYRVRRLYERGVFVGYIIVQFTESKPPATIPSGETARQWLAHNRVADQYAFECTFDKALLTATPYQLPQKGNPYYNEQWERRVGTNDNYEAMRVYDRGMFIGYALFMVAPVVADNTNKL